MTFDIILAMDIKCGIGKDGKLPWNIPEEMAWFKKMTMWTQDPDKQNAVIMGRKTWESLPERYRPLPGRYNVVLSRGDETILEDLGERISRAELDNVCVARSLQAALDAVDPEDEFPFITNIETVYVIGGAEVYKEALAHKDLYRIHLSTIPHDYECDTHVRIPGDFESIADAHNVAFTSSLLVRRK